MSIIGWQMILLKEIKPTKTFVHELFYKMQNQILPSEQKT